MPRLLAILFALLLVVPRLHALSPEFREQLQPPASLPAEARVWKVSTGKYEIAARIISLENDVTLLEKAGGDEIPFPLSKLAVVDAIFARPVTCHRVDPHAELVRRN